MGPIHRQLARPWTRARRATATLTFLSFAQPRSCAVPRSVNRRRRLANDAFERRYVERTLASAGGNVTQAAQLAGVSRTLFSQLVSKHGLKSG